MQIQLRVTIPNDIADHHFGYKGDEISDAEKYKKARKLFREYMQHIAENAVHDLVRDAEPKDMETDDEE